MKKLLLLLVLSCITVLTVFAQNVGIGTTTPDSSALLDVHSNNKGFLPPRVALTATNIASPINNPAIGLLVYDTVAAGNPPYNVAPGYYYWNGTSWYPVVNKGKAFGDMQYWDGYKWILIPIGTQGQVLTVCGGIPVWGGCSGTVTISPTNNLYEGEIDGYVPDTWSPSTDGQIYAEAWTIGGAPDNSRICIKFDYSSIPNGATIDSAKLFLYSDPAPINGDKVDAQYGSSDACYVSRITTNWSSPAQFTWNNPPSITTIDQAVIPQSITSSDNAVVDATALVRDMLTSGNNGFFIQLQTEVTYNSRQYVSSYGSNPSTHPALVVSYHQ
jgi:hypothetical protein